MCLCICHKSQKAFVYVCVFVLLRCHAQLRFPVFIYFLGLFCCKWNHSWAFPCSDAARDKSAGAPPALPYSCSAPFLSSIAGRMAALSCSVFAVPRAREGLYLVSRLQRGHSSSHVSLCVNPGVGKLGTTELYFPLWPGAQWPPPSGEMANSEDCGPNRLVCICFIW